LAGKGPVRQPAQQTTTIDRSPDTPRRPVVLVVDDNDDVRESLGDALEVGGYDSAFAANGVEALAYLRAHRAPAAILTDLNMPIMNGWEFVRRLGLTRFGGIPVVVVSGSESARKRLPHPVLRKPVTLDDLLSTVRAVTRAA
jgi:CheY-like chemotaxis protein